MDNKDKAKEQPPKGGHEYNPVGMAGKKINPEEQPAPRTGGSDKGGANEKDE